ncbi:GNAT family N-acetyltransferase [Paenibacillus caui]|uniref:GNAT family N-acetyltransferase n=1 Tax=Paenibacillus caui TaxID=2873927 RepID=UPI001CAA2F5C|nr:GNAT family N-acetyltransferase [Paenibacillus caui]
MLNPEDWEQIKALQIKVEQEDNISLKLNWDMLRSRKAEDQDDFICRQDGRIVAFLGLYDFASKIEVCGMVSPEYRRQGLFTSLLQEALPKERADRYKEIWLNTPADSLTGKAFAVSVGATPGFSEYQMKYSAPASSEAPVVLAEVHLRPAESLDRNAIISLDAQGFEMTEEEAASIYERQSGEKDSLLYMIEYKGESAGKLLVNTDPKQSWIYGFVIFDHFRGQGIGRSALMQIVKQEYSLGRDVFLEVALNNDRALHLYKSCGFETVQVQDYYGYRP